MVKFLQRLSFMLWIGCTIFSVVLMGFGIDIICYSALIAQFAPPQPFRMALVNTDLVEATTGGRPFLFPVALILMGLALTFICLRWRDFGIKHFHYLESEQLGGSGDDEEPTDALRDLIRRVEESSVSDRTAARAESKAWLISHASSLGEEDILLARAHFGYLLPDEWGVDAVAKGATGKFRTPPQVF